MDDAEFIRRMRQRIEESVGAPVELELDEEEPEQVDVYLNGPRPRVVMGAAALQYPGLARTFIQYAILCIRENRRVDKDEFERWLRRN